MQLSQKQVEMKKILMKFSNELWKIYPDIRSYIQKCRKKENGLMCNFYGVKPSPVTEGYRNKCEFTVGIDEETGLKTVGFRIGTYADGSTGVAPISELRHICDEMKQAVSVNIL